MYERYWGLTEKPFENTPDPRFFFQSKQHREALMRLLYAIHEAKGAALLTGEYGCGKTTLIRTVINELDQHLFPVVLLTNPRWDSEELLQEMASSATVIMQAWTDPIEIDVTKLRHFYDNYVAVTPVPPPSGL